MSDLLQILEDTSARPSATFKSGSVNQDLDSGVPTVTITRPDGTTIAPGTVTHFQPAVDNPGKYEFTLQPQSDPVNKLTITWAGPIGGITQTIKTYVEVIGAFLFNVDELRALRVAGGTPFASTSTWPDSKLMDARTATLDEFIRILGFSPVPRFHRETHDGDGSSCVLLDELEAHRLLSVTVNGASQSVAGYTLKPSGILEATSNYALSGTFTAGRGNVVVEYVAGWDRVAGDGSNVAMLRAAMRLDPGISSAAPSVTTPDGVSYQFDPAGQITRSGRVREFGVPAIDSWLSRWAAGSVAVA